MVPLTEGIIYTLFLLHHSPLPPPESLWFDLGAVPVSKWLCQSPKVTLPKETLRSSLLTWHCMISLTLSSVLKSFLSVLKSFFLCYVASLAIIHLLLYFLFWPCYLYFSLRVLCLSSELLVCISIYVDHFLPPRWCLHTIFFSFHTASLFLQLWLSCSSYSLPQNFLHNIFLL